MGRESVRARTRVDLAVVAAVAIVAIATAAYADRDFMSAQLDGNPRQGFSSPRHPPDRPPTWAGPLRYQAARAQTDFVTFLGVASGGLALAMLGRRVAAGRRGRRGPGAVAVAVAAGILGLRALEVALVGALYGFSYSSRYIYFFMFWVKLELDVSIAIVGAWAALTMAGRWRARDDRWDRLGRRLGWAWIGVFGYRIFSPAFWAWCGSYTNHPWF